MLKFQRVEIISVLAKVYSFFFSMGIFQFSAWVNSTESALRQGGGLLLGQRSQHNFGGYLVLE